MPYGRKKPYYKRNKRYTKPYKKKRFSKKKFVSSAGKTVVKAPIQARELYVKLHFTQSRNQIIASQSGLTLAVLGNSLIPLPQLYNGTISSGDLWCAGVTEYASFYNLYRVLGSSIKIQITQITTNNVVRCVIVPVAVGGPETGTSHTVADKISELDGLTYDQIIQQPYVTNRILGIASGGPNTLFLKLFRKSKSMISIKDIRDNQDTMIRLPDIIGSNGQILCSSPNAWFYYVRIFNAGAQTTIDYSIKVKYYVQLAGRTTWTTVATPA